MAIPTHNRDLQIVDKKINVLRDILFSVTSFQYNYPTKPGGLKFLLVFFIFFNKFIYFNWRLITLQYWSGFRHTLTWISHGCTCVPILTPSPLPPHPIPQGLPSAPALSTLSDASNLDWRSISHMIIYMFQCYSLRSSHPCLLPQSPKVCSLNLWLFCCLACSVIVTIFINSIYLR